MCKICFWAFVPAFLAVCAPVYAMNALGSLQTYQQERDEKNKNERLLFARITAARSKNPDVISEAVWDVVNYSTSRQENLFAIELVNSVLKRLSDESDAYRESVLAKGKLLARARQKDTVDALFQEVIRKRWKNAVLRYSESLIECGYLDEACMLEFERIAGLQPYRYYRGEDESLETFLSLLRRIKRDKPDCSLRSIVFENLPRAGENDPYTLIAKALCLSEDGHADEGIAILTGLDEKFFKSNRHTPKNLRDVNRYKNHREYKHIPLYMASVMYEQGKDFELAQESYTRYIERNKGKNKKILASTLRLARDLSLDGQGGENWNKFVEFIQKSIWFNDENVRKDFTPDEFSNLRDLQQIEEQ